MAVVPRRLRSVLGAATLVVALGACGDDSTSAPASTTAEEEPTTTASTGEDPAVAAEAAVLRAYEESWRRYADFVNGEASGDPRDYFDGDMLTTIEARIAEYDEGGYELRGEAELSPTDVAVDDSVARLTDCQLDGTYAVEADTGQVVVPASTRPQLVDVRLVRAGGRWKVASVAYGAEGSCTR
jgi:hypothetical protein